MEPGRPVDCLRQLLVECGGTDSQSGFFFVYLSPTIMVQSHAWIFKCFIPSTEKLHGVVKLIYSVS